MGISAGMALAVLFAAFLHALWNALIKGGGNSFLDSVVLAGASTIISLLLLPFVGIPHPDCWRYLITSAFAQAACLALLANSYRFGDLSIVYTIVRGVPPILIAVVGLVFAGENLNFNSWAGIFLVSFGIIILGFKRNSPSLSLMLFSLGTIIAITGYVVIDAFGVRLSGNSLSYWVWACLIYTSIYVMTALCLKRGELVQHVKENWRRGSLGAVIFFLSYAIVLWAMTQAPMGIVSSLRETSVLFAYVLGVVFLSEKFNKSRAFAAILVVCGVILIKLY